MLMHQAPPDHDPTHPPSERDKPRHLSQSDPPPGTRAGSRPPILLIIIVVLLVIGVIVVHLIGVLGPGSH
jgi:hypothetical protein